MLPAIRPKLMQMDMQTQWPEMRRLGASPDYTVGSVHAVTEHGEVFVASASGSQLAAYVYGAGAVIWVVGSQVVVVVVPDHGRADPGVAGIRVMVHVYHGNRDLRVGH